MAPPFNIDTTTPADDEIVSQFPANERTHRTTLENIWTQEHDEGTGRHQIPRGNTATRDALTDLVDGSWFENSETGTLDVRESGAWVHKYGLLVTGDFKVTAYSPSSPPSGWLECNGQAVSRTTYADLFGVIGSIYGNGDGSTTFNVPDFRGHVPVGFWGGSGDGDGDYVNVGETHGEKTHALTESELPSHTHTFTTDDDGAHDHTVPAANAEGSGIRVAFAGSDAGDKNIQDDGSTSTHQHSGTTDATGSGDAHENRPLSLTVGWLIKT